MPQSLHQVYGHIVFSIKDRENTITGDIEQKLYAYLGGIIRDLKGAPVLINGMPDHVHLLVRASKSITDIDFMRQLKGSSSKWLNENGLNGFVGRVVTVGSVSAQKIYQRHEPMLKNKKNIIRR